jgi:hypothetical protein
MRKFKLSEILLVVFVVGSFYFTWRRNINIQYDQIPSIINGMVTSVSMITGFSGAIMIFMLSKQWEKLKLGMARPLIYLVLLGLPLSLLWTTYSLFLDGNFDYALRMSMSNLAIASAILIDFLAYYARETVIHMRRQTDTDRD